MGLQHSSLIGEDLKPKAVDVKVAELVVNLESQTIWTKNDAGEVVSVGGGQGGLITQNMNILDKDFELEVGFSGVVTSGFVIANGITLTIPNGSVLVVA